MSVRVNAWSQRECRGCAGLGGLLHDPGARDNAAPWTSRKQLLHSSFRELDHCAFALGCVACQVFRRALLLEVPTNGEADMLAAESRVTDAITVRYRRRGQHRWLEVTVESKAHSRKGAVALSNSDEPRRYPALQYKEPLDPARTTRLKEWISTCHRQHLCSNYAYSIRNPTWLIQLLPDKRIKLVPGHRPTARGRRRTYVALSYCWGDRASITAADSEAWTRVAASATNSTNLSARQQPFPSSDLVESLQDAISIVASLSPSPIVDDDNNNNNEPDEENLQAPAPHHIWIDSICVPAGTWALEAHRMHEVYGNAHFTLCSSSATKATDRLLGEQSAWRDECRGCRLHGPWMLNVDRPLRQVRATAPVASRGWILQEERLSPRILYWCAQRAYWSCCQGGQRMEARQPGGMWWDWDQDWDRDRDEGEGGEEEAQRRKTQTLSHPQHFMKLCREGDLLLLPAEWADLVAAFARRYFSPDKPVVENRFAALSGLAARYMRSTSAKGARNLYLAGLWKNTIAQNLAWRVERLADPRRNYHPDVPSWSWLSLPLGTEMSMPIHVDTGQYFALLTGLDADEEDAVEDVIKKGAEVKELRVSSRLRPLVFDEYAFKVPWDGIERQPPLTGFDFSADPEQAMYSKAEGRVLVYEANQQEVLGDLDYLVMEEGGDDEADARLDIVDGDERRLYCLEIGARAMLILQPMNLAGRSFRRVGVAYDYRRNFFDNADVVEVGLW